MRRALRLWLCLSIVLASSGDAWQAFAGDKVWDSRTNSWTQKSSAQAGGPQAATAQAASLPGGLSGDVAQAVLADPRLPADQRQLAIDYLKRYGSALDNGDEATRQDLQQAAKDLKDPGKDPAMALAHLFERTAQVSKQAEAGAQITQVISQEGPKTVTRVTSAMAGKVLFTLETNKVDSEHTIKIVRKPDPATGKDDISAIILQESKGAVTEQRVLYNRGVHDLLRNLKRLYYDQCNLVRRINNGGQELTNTGCPQEEGYKDPNLTDRAKKALRALYDKNKNAFPKELADYLAELDKRKADGTLGELKDWKKLQDIQRQAMTFYQNHQLQEYQRMVIQQLVSYFSSVTGVQPKQQKGDDEIDRTAKELGEFQKALDDFHNGNMQGYSWLLSKLGYDHLDENDKKYVTQDVLSFASEAFATVAYAAQAQGKLYDPNVHLTDAEKDALLEQAGNWMKLAQVQVQAFSMNMQAMELRRLADGRMANGMGISVDDKDMIARANKLADTIDKEYIPELRKANGDMKDLLLRQAVANFQLNYQTATEAQVYNDTEHERLRLLSGKVSEMTELYLAKQFEKVRSSAEYRENFTAAEKVQAGAYRYFLGHLPGDVAEVRRRLELFKRKLDYLEPLESVEAIRAGLTPLWPEFEELAKTVTGLDALPKISQVKKESEKQATDNGRLAAAVQSFSNNAQLFSYLNQLDLYVDQYASSKMVWSQSDSYWTQLAKFKWLDWAYNKATFGLREKAINADMAAGVTGRVFGVKEAYEKLKADTQTREALKVALRAGDFIKVDELAQKLDPEGAERAKKQALLDKLDQNPSDALDINGLFAKQYQNDAQVGAFGATVSRFKLLTPLMLGYAGASAGFDTGATMIATAVAGPFVAWASRAGSYVVRAGQEIQFFRAIEAMENASKMVQAWNRVMRLTNVFGGTIEYMGNWMLNSGRNMRKILGLPEIRLTARTPWGRLAEGTWTAAGQIPLGFGNAFKSTIGSTWIMGIVSGGMQGATYALSPDSGQYADFRDAFLQGFVQGAAFGAKAGMLNHFSPVPATAFKGRWSSAAVRYLANVQGPFSGAVDAIAKSVPSLAKSSVGESGFFGALSKSGIDAAWQPAAFAARTATWFGAMADGSLKYWLAAELPQMATEAGYMMAWSPSDGSDPDGRTGSTRYVSALAAAHFIGTNVAQLSWVLLPTNPAFSPKEIKDQQASSNVYNLLVAEGREREIAMAPNGFTIDVERPWYKLGISEWPSALLGLKPSSERLTVNEQWRAQAWKRMSERMNESDLLALSVAPLEGGNGQVVDMARLRAGIDDPAGLLKYLKGDAPGKPKLADIVKIEVLNRSTHRWEPVDPASPQARWVQGQGMDGELQVKDGANWVKVGSKDGLPVARVSFAGKDTQVRITIESVTAAKTELEKRVATTDSLRTRILMTPEGGSLELPGGARVSGASLDNLRKTAELAQLDRMPAMGSVANSVDMLGRVFSTMLDRKVDSQQQRIGHALSEGTRDEARSIARSDKESARVVADQARQLMRTAEMQGDRDALAVVLAKLTAGDRNGAVAKLDETAAAKKAAVERGEQELGIPANTFVNLRRGLQHELTADIVTAAARREVSSKMGPRGAAVDLAMRDVERGVAEAKAKGKTLTPAEVRALALDAFQARKADAPDTFARLSAGVAQDQAALASRGKASGEALLVALRRRVLAELGPDNAALSGLRQSLEGDAARQAVVENALNAFKAGDDKALSSAIDLYLDIWERGVFGQMVGEIVPVQEKGADGKPLMKDGKPVYKVEKDAAGKPKLDPDGNPIYEVEWSIPKERQFRNRAGFVIPGFRDLQRRVIKQSLLNIAKGERLNFGQMPTGGGKTLTNFTLIEFLTAHAKAYGREGVIYLTTTPDLVAQAKEDYLAFFGKKPAFDIMTYGDLSAQIAQAKEQGLPSPLSKYYIVADEGDKPASEVPTSVGLFNGMMSMAAIDPVQQTLQKAAKKFVDDPDGFFQKHPSKGRVNEAEFAELMKDKKFRGDFQALVDKTETQVLQQYEYMKSPEFRDKIDVSQYPEYLALYKGDYPRAQRELQKTMVAEYKHAVRTAKLLHGSLEARLSTFFQGGYQFASVPVNERSTKLIADPSSKKRGTFQFNNGTAYDNLSTPEGPFGSAYFERPISNEFETAGVLDYRGLIQEAKDTGTIFFATSGTAAAAIRDVFINDFGFKFIGEISVPEKPTLQMMKPGEDWTQVEDTMRFVDSGHPQHNVVFKFAHTLEEWQQLLDDYNKWYKDHGYTGPSRIATLVRPGSALEKFERHNQEVKEEENQAAFERGDAEIVILVGWAGLRGLEANLSKYKGRQGRMDILDPQKLPTEELTQLIGRLAPGRAGMLSHRDFHAIIRPEALDDSQTLPAAAAQIGERLRADADGRADVRAAKELIDSGNLKTALDSLRAKVEAGAGPKAEEALRLAQSKPEDFAQALADAVSLNDENLGLKAGARNPKDGNVKGLRDNPLWDYVLLPTIKDPNNLEASDLVTKISETRRLREALGPDRADLLKLDDKALGPRLQVLIKSGQILERPGFLDVLVAAMGRQEQKNAISSSGILNRSSASGGGLLSQLKGLLPAARGPALPSGGVLQPATP